MKHILFACALFVTFLSSCTDETSDFTPVKPGDGIKFAASSATNARTIYDDENIFQINWQDQDAIKIYSNKPYQDIDNADYKVTPIKTIVEGSTNELYNTGKIEAVGNDKLHWVDNAPHQFIGIYPNDNPKISVQDGIVTFPINRNQIVDRIVRLDDKQPTVNPDDPTLDNSFVAYEKYYKKYRDSGYTYYCVPDMKNAYLTAFTNITPNQAAQQGGNVSLDFKPVMTTLEIVIKGKDGSANDSPLIVTGVSVSRKLPQSSTEQYDSFKWNPETCQLSYGTTQRANTNTSGVVEQTLVSFKTNKELELYANESAVITVFLPPLEVNEQNQIKVRVHTLGASEITTKFIGAQDNPILASNKRRITLPTITPKTTNNWITPLDDNIYISQLSIPGTHDSGTGDGTQYDIAGFKWGVTQALNITQQLNMGIRAFDLRPANLQKQGLWIFHGPFKMNNSWEDVMTFFKDFLKANPDEFIIALIRHEFDPLWGEADLIPGNNGHNKPVHWRPRMQTALTKIAGETNPSNNNESYTVNFRPDLTISDCRGKIVFLCRTQCPYTDNDLPVVGGYLDWNHNMNGGQGQIYGVDGRPKTNNLDLQDYYKEGSGNDDNDHSTRFVDKKWTIIQNFLGKSSNYHTDNNLKNQWCINHISGYDEQGAVTAGYVANASVNNKRLYEELTRQGRANGSTGILLIDWLGSDHINKTGVPDALVYGARLPQAIINNNYKYRMKRRGE